MILDFLIVVRGWSCVGWLAQEALQALGMKQSHSLSCWSECCFSTSQCGEQDMDTQHFVKTCVANFRAFQTLVQAYHKVTPSLRNLIWWKLWVLEISSVLKSCLLSGKRNRTAGLHGEPLWVLECGCPSSGSVQNQVGKGLQQSGLVAGVELKVPSSSVHSVILFVSPSRKITFL